MYASPTINNSALASAVNGRIKADARLIGAKAALWRMGGFAVLFLGIGLGIGAACYGYSYISDNRTSAEKMASAFATALDHANLGTVRLNPESTVQINPDAVVHLNTDGAAPVKLEPGSTVHLAGDIPRPTTRQLAGGGDQQSAVPASTPTKIVTHYTIFKSAHFGKGDVVTGWNFTSNTEDFPEEQYCYYAEKGTETASFQLQLARDGKAVPQDDHKFNIDFSAAIAQCIWYR